MRIPSSHVDGRRVAEPAMTPMIDVVFLLLIFFVWTASFQAIEKLLPSELTAQSGTGATAELAEEDFEKVVVRLRGGPNEVSWLLNGQRLGSLTQVQDRLNQLASIRADLPVVIDPEPTVLLGDVIAVYDIARQVGLPNIQFTTESPP